MQETLVCSLKRWLGEVFESMALRQYSYLFSAVTGCESSDSHGPRRTSLADFGWQLRRYLFILVVGSDLLEDAMISTRKL